MDYRKQRAVTKSRNQFHDLFHDIRGRNSFHATRFSTSLSSSSASPSSPRSPFPWSRTHRRIVCRPEQIRVQEIEEQVDQDPNNLVIGTLIPSSFLHRPRRRLAARSAPTGVEPRTTKERASRAEPFPSRLSFFVSPPPLFTFTRMRLHTNCTGVYSSFVRFERIEMPRSKVPFRAFLLFLILRLENFSSLFSDGDAREKALVGNSTIIFLYIIDRFRSRAIVPDELFIVARHNFSYLFP